MLVNAVNEVREIDLNRFPLRYRRVVPVGTTAGIPEKPQLLQLYVDVKTVGRVHTKLTIRNMSHPFMLSPQTSTTHRKNFNTMNVTVHLTNNFLCEFTVTDTGNSRSLFSYLIKAG